MPRQNNGLEILKGISKVEAFSIVPSGGDTVTEAAIALGAASVAVDDETDFTNGDPIFIIGDGGLELNKVGVPNATMPLGFKAAVAQGVGARMVEVVARNLGHVDENGVSYNASLQLTAIDAATSATPLAYMRGAGELSAQFNLRGFNNLNFQLAHGVDELEGGAGTSADPYQVSVGGTEIGTHGLICLRVTGYRFDLKTVTRDFLNCTMEVAVREQLGGRTPGVTPISVKFDRVVQRIWS
jgi:hypothetical protein